MYDQHYRRLVLQHRWNLKEAIETKRNHNDIVRFVATAFSSQSVIEKSGYSFLAVEPLESFGSMEGGKTFDILIVSWSEKRIVLIEVKTSDSARKILGDIRECVAYTERRFDTLKVTYGLSDFVFDDVEFVVCIEKGGGSYGVQTSLNNCLKDDLTEGKVLSKSVASRVMLWPVYWEDVERRITLEGPNPHKSGSLNMVLRHPGISRSDISGNVSIPFLLTDPPWILILHMVSYLLNENFGDVLVQNKKELKVSDMIDYISSVASAGAVTVQRELTERAALAVEKAIEYGVVYDLFVKKEDSVEIKCRGTVSKDTILKNFRAKFEGTNDVDDPGTYAEKKAEEEAMVQTVEDFRKIHSPRLEHFK